MKEKQEKLKEDEQRNSIADISVGYGLNYTAYLYIKNKNQHLKLSTAFQIFRKLIFCSFVIVSASLSSLHTESPQIYMCLVFFFFKHFQGI